MSAPENRTYGQRPSLAPRLVAAGLLLAALSWTGWKLWPLADIWFAGGIGHPFSARLASADRSTPDLPPPAPAAPAAEAPAIQGEAAAPAHSSTAADSSSAAPLSGAAGGPVRLLVWSKLLRQPDGTVTGVPAGFIDETGQLVLPAQSPQSPQWDDVAEFREGFARIRIGKLHGFIDASGEVIIPATFDDAAWFSDGFCRVRSGEKYGFIDLAGQVAVPAVWEDAGAFGGGLAPAKKGGRWGFIDRRGDVSLPFKWEFASRFSEDLAAVKEDGRYGFIDRTGRMVILPKWPFAEPFAEDRARFHDQSPYRPPHYGYLNRNGESLNGAWWDQAEPYAAGLAAVCKDKKWGFIDRQEHEVIELDWDFAHSYRDHRDAPVFRLLIQFTSATQATALWLGPDRQEIWRAELPLETE